MDNILKQLSKAVKFTEELKHPPVLDFSQFHGTFREKLEFNLVSRKQKCGATITIKSFSWKKCEIGKNTGNQLLRILVALCRSFNDFSAGTCVILTTNGYPDAAIYLLSPTWLELNTPSLQDPEKRRYFSKIFDEQSCRSMKEDSDYSQQFTDEKLNKLRAQVPLLLRSFLHQPVGDTSPEFRYAFIGMLQELSKFEFKDVTVYDLTRKIPVASCIWLAIHQSMSHKLQALFGDHYFPVQDLFRKWRTEDPLISEDELHQRLSLQKAELRLDAAKTILASTIPVDSDGSYDINRIEQIVNQVEEVFQISASY